MIVLDLKAVNPSIYSFGTISQSLSVKLLDYSISEAYNLFNIIRCSTSKADAIVIFEKLFIGYVEIKNKESWLN